MDQNFWNVNAKNWAQAIQMKTISSRPVTNQAIVDDIIQKKVTTLLDIGCGEGWLGSALQTKNIDYFGIDGSLELIQIAKETQKLHFDHATYEDILSGRWKPNRKFDAVCFNFALFDDPISPLLKTVSSFLSPGGYLFIQTLHPCFLSPYKDSWQIENFKAMQIPFEGSMNWFGRTLGSWFKEFAQAGLQVESLTEPMINEAPASMIFKLQVKS